MKAVDLQNTPKLMAEKIQIGYTPEYFVFGVSSGSQAHVYSLTPAHAKRLLQYLQHEIASYETKHGEIKAEWTPNIVSPVQLKQPPSDSGN